MSIVLNICRKASVWTSSSLGNWELESSAVYLVSSQAGRQLSQKWADSSSSLDSRSAGQTDENHTLQRAEIHSTNIYYISYYISIIPRPAGIWIVGNTSCWGGGGQRGPPLRSPKLPDRFPNFQIPKFQISDFQISNAIR